MRRTAFLAASAATVLGAAAAGAATDGVADTAYDLLTPTGTLGGTLALPPGGATKVPVVLIVAGSGPTDRDGNQPALRLDVYKKLAHALATRGVASVRYDKRGIAGSRAAATAESTLRFETYVDDAAAWLAKLRADRHFGAVSVAGHSEGSLLGMIAVQRAAPSAFVSLEGAGFPAADVLRKQLADRLATQPTFLAESNRILDALARGSTVNDAPPELDALFRASLQPYLISWFKYDPRVEIAKVACRTTIVQGTHDVQVSLDDGRALAAAKPDATFVKVDGMTHVLCDDPGTTLEQQLGTAYADASRPIDARAIDAVVAAARG